MQEDVASYDVAMHGYTLFASYFGPRDKTALLLHGGGQTSSADIFPLRIDLAERGIGTLALDHRGHGKTGGELTDSSLSQRVEEAQAAIEAVRPTNLLGAVSMSMGGYIAVKLTRVIALRALAMIAPAMYHAAAFDVPFGTRFSAIIRRRESWRQSDAWEILRTYAGRVLVIAGEEDERIPSGVITGCIEAVGPGEVELISLAGVDHFVMSRLREVNDGRLPAVLDKIAKTLDEDGVSSVAFE